MDAVWVVVVASLATSVVSPLVMWWTARSTRVQEWARQDQVAQRTEDVAAQAAQAARLLIESNRKIARVQGETAVEAARIATEASAKLDQIHVLVNSSMTEAMQGELDAIERYLAMMRELIEVKRASGSEPTAAALALVTATQDKLDGLRSSMSDRMAQTEVADGQLGQR
jgi:hypothetical protein